MSSELTIGFDAPSAPVPPAFSLLSHLYSDATMQRTFSEQGTVEVWLSFQAALARAHAAVGTISAEDAEAISSVCKLENIDTARLWAETTNIGYPILPLVRQLAEQLPEGPGGRVHLGATTQDAMDTGLALQLRDALNRFDQLLLEVGNKLAGLVDAHQSTVMAARTHGQQAVPTTLGAKLAVFLEEVSRHRERLAQLRDRVCVVSMYGAGGTAAAYGENVEPLREHVAADLKLGIQPVPWHVARDSLAEFGFVCAGLAETCARLGREVIDLSRTEIGEVKEAGGRHRGASSTMPQKANPISSEALVGLAVVTSSLTPAMLRAMEAGHERAAGEWQAEWEALPRMACLSAASLAVGTELLRGLRVDEGAMRHNLGKDGGTLMAEAYMIRLAPELGRERAHDVVYDAVRASRSSGRPLVGEIAELTSDALNVLPLEPHAYLGEADRICASALSRWQSPTTESKK